MSSKLQPLNLSDWTGGLNLRADAFQLKDNESPEMLNVSVDPRGGVRARHGWERWNETEVEPDWTPTRLHVWEQSSGARDVLVVTDDGILTGADGTLTVLEDASAAIVTAAAVHGADFADWGDLLYIACGRTVVARKWDGDGDAVALTASSPTFQNDYTAPTTNYFPKSDFVTTYQGYMVCASTSENGTAYPNRVRFSHPNNPENWAALDYIDIQGGGGRITGLASFSDHVVVFKTNSVWAIYGNDADSFTPVNITMAVGAIHRNAVTVTDMGAYFYSHPNGVHEYQPGEGVREISTQLRPIIDSGELNASALDNMFMGFLNRRLWWSVPYEKDAVATDCRSTFVYDPSIDAWTRYTDADGDGLGPFATGGKQGDGALLLAAHRIHGYLLVVGANDDAVDTIDSEAAGFPTMYATRWLHADWPSLRKSWRRADYIVTELPSEWNLNVKVFRDYDESSPRTSHNIHVVTGGNTHAWGEVGLLWGEPGLVWGSTPRGSRLERGGSIGLAKAVQLKFSGEVGKPWGLNAVVMKYRNRRFR